VRRVHIIAIGGSVMHALAVALQRQGYQVSGSDDRLEDPARSRLLEAGLLPEAVGWAPERITPELDLVIVGRHALPDNPELQKARALGLPILDMPTFIAEASRTKHRLSVIGSHGKTTTTALLLYSFQQLHLPTDWLLGAPPQPHHPTLSLSDAPTILLEGDEYPASAWNLQPKAAVYKPHWLLFTGVAWDHANVYPTPQSYEAAFGLILEQLPKGGLCVYNETDPVVCRLVGEHLRPGWHYLRPYGMLPYFVKGGTWYVRIGRRVTPVRFWGRHNILNAAAVWKLLQEFWVEDETFAEILSTFELPAGRQEIWHHSPDLVVVRDFAHAPSKVQATLSAVRETFPRHRLLAVLELHTYSSFLPAFLKGYRGPLRKAQERWFYVEPSLRLSRGVPSLEILQKALSLRHSVWFEDKAQLIQALRARMKDRPLAVVLMSSGTFSGLRPEELGLEEVTPEG
jgi:UDP-N-acetylmuramate: L-alanyl-gamma-D-glutamyl-meso-diaminopimelate ligase